MHTELVDLETFAHVLHETQVTGRHDNGPILAIAGFHPDLAGVNLVQGVAGAVIVSELPLSRLEWPITGKSRPDRPESAYDFSLLDYAPKRAICKPSNPGQLGTSLHEQQGTPA